MDLLTLTAITAWSTVALALITLGLAIFAFRNLKILNRNVELVAQSVEKQADAITLQNTDVLLTHKPVVFIKMLIEPSNLTNPLDPIWVLTNTGKLPARNVTVNIIFNVTSSQPNIVINNYQIKPVEKAVIYPGADLILNLYLSRIGREFKYDKAELIFIIQYYCEGLTQEMSDVMKFIFSDQTRGNWVYTGPSTSIFFHEKFERFKSKNQILANHEITNRRQRIMKEMVETVGTDYVRSATDSEINSIFDAMLKEMHESSEGEIWLLEIAGIIDRDNKLTPIGINAVKCVAEVLADEDISNKTIKV